MTSFLVGVGMTSSFLVKVGIPSNTRVGGDLGTITDAGVRVGVSAVERDFSCWKLESGVFLTDSVMLLWKQMNDK